MVYPWVEKGILMKREDYLDEWKKLSPIIVEMTKKDGRCNHVDVQDLAVGEADNAGCDDVHRAVAGQRPAALGRPSAVPGARFWR